MKETDATFILLSDEAWHHLNGHTNSHSNTQQSVENPMLVHELAAHAILVGKWYSMSASRFHRPLFHL
jgi:hypothetical protein